MSYKANRVKLHRNHAIEEIELMHKAIDLGDYKEAMRHKIIAGVAIDEMVNVSDMTEKHD